MSDEQNSKPQDTKPPEASKETKVVELNESFAGKSQPGNQGILLNPVGDHNTDPFVSQDTHASPAPPTPNAPETSPASSAPTPPVDTSSSKE